MTGADWALKVVEFCHVLRGLGVRVSVPEMLDAGEALSRGDWTDPRSIRGALRATLIKRADDLPLFDRAMAAFFGREAGAPVAGGGSGAGEEARQAVSAKAEAELQFQGKPLPLPAELQEVYGRMKTADQERLRTFLERTSTGANVKAKFQPVVEKMLIASLEYWRRQLAEEEETSFPIQLTGEEQVDAVVEEAARHLRSDLQALLYRDMQRIGEDELPLMRKVVKQMVKHLSGQLSRRTRRSSLGRRLDLRRTIRQNLRFGGVLLQVKYKAAAVAKPKVVLLCDVSGSMARYAVFVLQFMYGLSSHIQEIESFIFAEDLERMTLKFRKKERFAEVMSRIMTKSDQWGKGTDLHTSLVTLRRDFSRVLQPATVFIVLSDGKTLKGPAAAAELAAIGKRVKRVIWLNTQPIGEWDRHKTTALFRKQTRMVPCNTLADLIGIVRSELFRFKR